MKNLRFLFVFFFLLVGSCFMSTASAEVVVPAPYPFLKQYEDLGVEEWYINEPTSVNNGVYRWESGSYYTTIDSLGNLTTNDRTITAALGRVMGKGGVYYDQYLKVSRNGSHNGYPVYLDARITQNTRYTMETFGKLSDGTFLAYCTRVVTDGTEPYDTGWNRAAGYVVRFTQGVAEERYYNRYYEFYSIDVGYVKAYTINNTLLKSVEFTGDISDSGLTGGGFYFDTIIKNCGGVSSYRSCIPAVGGKDLKIFGKGANISRLNTFIGNRMDNEDAKYDVIGKVNNLEVYNMRVGGLAAYYVNRVLYSGCAGTTNSEAVVNMFANLYGDLNILNSSGIAVRVDNFGGNINLSGSTNLILRLTGYSNPTIEKWIQTNTVIEEIKMPSFPTIAESSWGVVTPGGGTPLNWAGSGTVTLKNCQLTSVREGTRLPVINNGGSGGVIINGGTYTGCTAFKGSNIVVNKGTIVDIGAKTSGFIVGEDSEASTSVVDNKTITTVKLSNPPIIIDWGDFPGIDLDIDLAPPIIEVVRTPAGTTTPTDKVTLTIRAKDSNGHDDPKPISINGGEFQASPCTYTVTENQIVSIIARDANGNTRSYDVNISNIDTEAPEIIGYKQSTVEWTKTPVKVTVEAQDDIKLHATAYKFEFHPNGGSAVSTQWQSLRSYDVPSNGVLYCYVRDAMGKETKSDGWEITNIDLTPPTFTYSLEPKAGVLVSPAQGVTINISIQNIGDSVTQNASKLSDTPIKWGAAEVWSSEYSKVVHENGTYNVQVRDSVGNVSAIIPVTVSNINTEKPVIDALTGTHLAADYVQAPVTLAVSAHAGRNSPLDSKPYSWDGGVTWTSLRDFKVYNNGEYTVKVRDMTGTTVEASIIVSNIDAVKPTASVYLFKGLPADGTGEGPDDYVWKIRVEAADVGSGVDHIETLWDGGTHTSMPIIQDIEEPGVYGIIVYDKAGNQIYAEKTVTAESIGESTGSNNNAYVDIKVPSGGSAGSHFGASLGDLIYGPTGAYNKATDTFKTYQSGAEGITCNIIATSKNGTWLTGYATFNSVKYPVTFGGADGVRGGKNIEASVYIPISGITTDVRNGRLVLVLQEWDNSSKTTLKREGSATLYTSVQVNSPKINYTYNKATDEMTLVATSAVAGIQSSTYNIGSGDVAYTAPFHVSGVPRITLTAVDKCQNVTSIELDGTTLPVAGGGGGMLPTEGITGEGVNSYYIAGRSSESYIIGGTRSNTDNVPSSSVFGAILGATP